MESDQLLMWERKIVGSLFLLSVFFGSGKATGVPTGAGGSMPPIDLRHPAPVMKTVMLEIDETTSKQTAPGSAVLEKNLKPVKVNHLTEANYKIKWGDTCWSIARRYGLSVTELARLNPGLNPEAIQSGEYLQVRKLSTSSRGRNSPRLITVPNPRDIALFTPVSGGRLTSGYGMRWGRMHRGIDLAAVAGTPIRAAAAGEVMFAGWKSGYGLMVIIDHGDFQTKYAHNSENLVRAGDLVETGVPIAKIGRTGNATGNHLHFELVIGGGAVNPLSYLK